MATFCSNTGMKYLELLKLHLEGFYPCKRVCSQKLPAGTARRTAPFAHYRIYPLNDWHTPTHFQRLLCLHDWHFPGKRGCNCLFFRNWRLLEGFALECQRPSTLQASQTLWKEHFNSAGETKTREIKKFAGLLHFCPVSQCCHLIFAQLQGLL